MDTLPAKPLPASTGLPSSSKAKIASIIGNQPRKRDSKRSREKQPETIQSTSTNRRVSARLNPKNENPNQSTTFEEGTDFIPFLPSDASGEESDDAATRDRTRESKIFSTPTRGNDKGKGKARDDTPLSSERAEANSAHRDRTPPSRRNRNTTNDNERRRERGDGDNNRDRDRRRDRDRDERREQNGTKRKYEMVFDPNDGYSNKKQRTDAASRKAPWVAGLDWERCNNVAEMYVS